MTRLTIIIFVISFLSCHKNAEIPMQTSESKIDSSKTTNSKIKTRKCFAIINGKKELIEIIEFDNSGRIIRSSYFNINNKYKSDIKYEYDKFGNKIKSIILEDGKVGDIWFRTYDNRNRLASEVYWPPSKGVSNVYNKYDYFYNAKIKIQSMYDSTFKYTGCNISSTNNFDSLALVVKFDRENRFYMVTKYKYNSTHQIIELHDSSANESSRHFTFDYDSIGNLIKKSEDWPPLEVTKFQYDTFRRITSSQILSNHCCMTDKKPIRGENKYYQYDSAGYVKSYDDYIINYINHGADSTVNKTRYQYEYEFFK